MSELIKNEKFDEKKIGEILEYLKISSTFNMSRGGRELFHTNFLAFILDVKYEGVDCQSYEAEVKRLILEQLFGVENTPKNVITFRERSNLDLIVVPALDELDAVKKVVVIEAKLKSIPTTEQLEKYNKKFERGLTLELFETLEFRTAKRNGEEYDFNISGVHVKITDCCTVSLVDSDCKRNSRPKEIEEVRLERFLLAPESIANNDLKGWALLGWSEFIERIKPRVNEDSLREKTLFGQLVEDYLESTKSVLNLVQQVGLKAELFTQNTDSWNDFFTFAVNKNDFKKMRLHDLVGKVAYNSLRNKLINDLEKDNHLEKTFQGFSLDTYTFYSRSLPGIGFQYKISKGKQTFSFGIQLQGNDYRHFIERNNCINPKVDLVSCASIIVDWIRISKPLDKSNKNSGFGVFDKTKFVHQQIKVENSTTSNSNESLPIEKVTKYTDLLTKVKSSLRGAILEIEKREFLSEFLDTTTSENEPHNGG